MARLRRSKLAAGFLLLFQCLSERCQLAAEETPSQSHGKPHRDRGRDGDTGLGSGSGLGVAPPPPAASPRRANGVWGPPPPLPREARGGRGPGIAPLLHRRLLREELPPLSLYLFILTTSRDFSSRHQSAPPSPVPFPCPGSSWGPHGFLPCLRDPPPRGEGLGREGKEASGSPEHRAGTPGDPPAALLAATCGSRGKVSLQLLPGHSAPLAQAGSLQPSLNSRR